MQSSLGKARREEQAARMSLKCSMAKQKYDQYYLFDAHGQILYGTNSSSFSAFFREATHLSDEKNRENRRNGYEENGANR